MGDNIVLSHEGKDDPIVQITGQQTINDVVLNNKNNTFNGIEIEMQNQGGMQVLDVKESLPKFPKRQPRNKKHHRHRDSRHSSHHHHSRRSRHSSRRRHSHKNQSQRYERETFKRPEPVRRKNPFDFEDDEPNEPMDLLKDEDDSSLKLDMIANPNKVDTASLVDDHDFRSIRESERDNLSRNDQSRPISPSFEEFVKSRDDVRSQHSRSSRDSRYSRRSSRNSHRSSFRDSRRDSHRDSERRRDSRYSRESRVSTREPAADKTKLKTQMLRKLNRLRRKGLGDGIPNLTMQDSYETVKEVFTEVMHERTLESGIKFSKDMIIPAISFLEWMNNRYNPFDLELDEWSDQVDMAMQDGEYDDVLEELVDRYSESVAVGPEMKLLMMLGGSAWGFHMSKRIAKQQQQQQNGMYPQPYNMPHGQMPPGQMSPGQMPMMQPMMPMRPPLQSQMPMQQPNMMQQQQQMHIPIQPQQMVRPEMPMPVIRNNFVTEALNQNDSEDDVSETNTGSEMSEPPNGGRTFPIAKKTTKKPTAGKQVIKLD